MSNPPTRDSFREGLLAMMRDDLLQQLAALPADADVGVQIGDDHLDIADVIAWGNGSFGALRCYPNDVRDLLSALRVALWSPGADRSPNFERHAVRLPSCDADSVNLPTR
jgi:hypothetical protein